jgi:ABC-type uncharacterized transport system substrate-binding protein
MAVDLSGKRLELLKAAIPNLSRVAHLIDSNDLAAQRVASAFLAAAKALGLDLRPIEVASPEALDHAFTQIASDKIDGMIIGPGSMMFNERARIGAFALAQKLPLEVVVAEMVPYGPLLSYGRDFPDYFRQAAAYTDKILRGAKPADLPVEQPARFKQVINLKTAKALGLVIPPAMLITADEVIE